MGVSGNKRKDKVIKAATTAINVTQCKLLWHCFGSELKKNDDMDDTDIFLRLVMFEYGLAAIISTDIKDLRYFKEEPLNEVTEFILSGYSNNNFIRKVKRNVVDILKNHISSIRTDAMFFMRQYQYCFSRLPSKQNLVGIIILSKLYNAIRTKFEDDGLALSKDTVDELARRCLGEIIYEMEESKSELHDALGIRRERVDDVIELLKGEARREGIPLASSTKDIQSSTEKDKDSIE